MLRNTEDYEIKLNIIINVYIQNIRPTQDDEEEDKLRCQAAVSSKNFPIIFLTLLIMYDKNRARN